MKIFLVFTMLLWAIVFGSCQVPQVSKIEENDKIIKNINTNVDQKFSEENKEPEKNILPKDQKTDMELVISREEKSKDSNYRGKYYLLKGNFLVFGEKISGRFSNQQKPEKIIELTGEQIKAIKENIIESGLNNNYEKEYIFDPDQFKRLKYTYFFAMDDKVIKVQSDTDVEDDRMVQNLKKLEELLEKLAK